MTRKTKIVTVEMEGRDKGRAFLIQEMAASQGERWANRAISAIGRSNPVLEDLSSLGMAGIAALGVKSLASIPWGEAEPLLAEMFECVRAIPNPSNPEVHRALIESDIDEVGTRLWLRSEVIELHTGFSLAAALSTLGAAAKKISASKTTPTSQAASERS